MGAPPQPRFTSLSDFQDYLDVAGTSARKQTVLPSVLASAERMVERYTRRRFAPEPALADPTSGYQRWTISITGSQTPSTATGELTLTFGGDPTGPLELPVYASGMQAALSALASIGAGNVTCSGGPLPTYPISITFAGTLSGEQPDFSADSSALSGSFAVLVDCGFDSAPPVAKRFTTRGKSVIRVPDLRAVDASPDPRLPNSGGISLYGRRLLPNQYSLGYDGYAAGGADEAIGSGVGAEPATEIVLGYGYGTGFSLASQFAYVLPLGYLSNDLQITGRWGWSPAPPDVIDAVYSVGARRYRERDAAFSDQMITSEGVIFQFFKQLPSSTKAALDTYRVPNIALVP